MPRFSPDCILCPRLARHLAEVRASHPSYHALPVAPFGALRPRLLVVGLAPGMHGANRTGRPFTGDHAGILLYETLHRFGFSSSPVSTQDGDGLTLQGCRITNAVKCLPPGNKPIGAEIARCNVYLKEELRALPSGAVILALGSIAHQAVLRALEIPQAKCRFSHGARHEMERGLTLFSSYHCSRYNTQTRRLTKDMFNQVFEGIVQDLSKIRPRPQR